MQEVRGFATEISEAGERKHEQKNISYYSSESAGSVLKEFSTSRKGLSHAEARRRLKEFGYNILVEEKGQNIVLKFLSNFKSPLILILLAAAAISFFIQQTSNGIIIIGIVIIAAFLDFIQEHSASRALRKLVESVRVTSTVIRENRRQEVPIKDLVAGDIIFLSSGDLVPADARVIEAEDFFVNQAPITGEAFPVEKIADKTSVSKSLIELENIILSGTNAVGGSATAVIIKTGKGTEFGKIASKVAATTKTEFEKGLGSFGFLLMKIALVLVIFAFFTYSLLRQDILNSLMFAIAIGVGITPDLLPMIMFVTMAIGSKKMSKKRVIVKRLDAIPNFGSMNILCTDKTGTLTENKIILKKYINTQGKEDENIFELSYLNSFFQTGIKNPIDDAILEYKKISIRGFKKISEIPYDFFRKKMSVIVEKNKERIIITKGAPEGLIESSSYYKKNGKELLFDKNAKNEMLGKYDELSQQGFRILGISTKKIPKEQRKFTLHDENNLVFCGFVAFFDPPRSDVKHTLKQIRELGIEVKIITGDNELVAKNVAGEVGLEIKKILNGTEIEKMNDQKLIIESQNVTIFARCTPDQKSRIMHALRANGNVVGYLGDGINDASALKSSDISISVNNAADVAKESADIILTKKSLGDLKEGIIEGRKTFANTMKYIMVTLSTNFGNILSIIAVGLFLPYFPVLPLQILLLNLLYDISQLTVPSDNVDEDWISKPKKWDVKMLKKFMYATSPLGPVSDFAVVIVLYYIMNVPAATFQTAWFLESFAEQTLVVHILRTKKNPLKMRASRLLLLTTISAVVISWIIPFTPLGKIFGFTALSWQILLIDVGITIIYLALLEIIKRRFYKKHSF